MAAGRPKKSLESKLKDMPSDWYDQILSLYKEGASDVEVKALIYSWLGSFSNDLWERWKEEEPQFSATIKTGKILSESWWHKKGRKNLDIKEFNYTGWYMQMKNRFGWADKQEIKSENELAITWNEEKTY